MPIPSELLKSYRNQIKPDLIDKLTKQGITARAAILKMTTLAGSGHPGGSMSSIDFLLSLYSQIEHNPQIDDRDHVIISHGHISPAAYSTLSINGYFPLDQLISQFRLAGSIFEGHVEPNVPGIEWASGNLGQGLSAGCGFALASKIKDYKNHVYVLMGDGEQQKGQISEARRFATKYKLNNLTAIVDYNDLQISGSCSQIMPQDIKAEYEANKWEVIEINGHNLTEIITAILYTQKSSKPSLILAHTVMGKGISFMENDNKWHGQALPYQSDNGLDLVSALAELGQIDDLAKLRKLREKFTPGKCSPVVLPKQEFQIKTGKHINYEQVTDNRSAWGNALSDLASLNNNKRFLPIAVFDCDLSDSVKTKNFAKANPDNFFQSGIMEHHTAVCAGALSKNGFQTFFSDFGVFGIDETYNQHRLNDINITNLKIVITHVGIDVGEDGKTHQCIDYLGQAKNMFHFKCILPADPNQTDHIIRWLAKQPGNFIVPMGRSKLEIIRKSDGSIFFDENYQFEYGKADLLHAGNDAALFVMGTLTGRALKIAKIAKKKDINLQVWNISTPQQIAPEVINLAVNTGNIFTYEDHNIYTGLASCIQSELVKEKHVVNFKAFGVEEYPVSGKSADVYKYCFLDAETVAQKIIDMISGKKC